MSFIFSDGGSIVAAGGARDNSKQQDGFISRAAKRA
jgi:hypothetical protein